MKFYKISVAALSALMLAACSDDDNLNTSDVTVNMKDATMLMAEDFSSTYYRIPVVLDLDMSPAPRSGVVFVRKPVACPICVSQWVFDIS